MEILKLLGILIVVVGFILKLDSILIIMVAAIVTALVSGIDIVTFLQTLGSSFVSNRSMCTFIIVLVLTGTLERNGLKQAAAEKKKGIISFSPLAQGMLTDRYLNGIPKDSRVNTDGRFLHADQFTEERLNSIRSLNAIAAERGESLAQMALKWILRDGIVTSVLIGASRPQQILENLKVLDSASFSEEELKKIDECSLAL